MEGESYGNPTEKSYGLRLFLLKHLTVAHRKLKKKPHLRKIAVGFDVEARGIEPRSRGISEHASTCVACLLSPGRNLAAPPGPFALRASDEQDARKTNPL